MGTQILKSMHPTLKKKKKKKTTTEAMTHNFCKDVWIAYNPHAE
jgi:hypothetical protein